jgi:hypothetical protein
MARPTRNDALGGNPRASSGGAFLTTNMVPYSEIYISPPETEADEDASQPGRLQPRVLEADENAAGDSGSAGLGGDAAPGRNVDADLPWGKYRINVIQPLTRWALGRAAGAGLNGGQWQLFAAVVQVTLTYSRIVERRRLELLAELAGRPMSWRIGADLRALADAGVIVYRPRRGVGLASIVGIPFTNESVADIPTNRLQEYQLGGCGYTNEVVVDMPTDPNSTSALSSPNGGLQGSTTSLVPTRTKHRSTTTASRGGPRRGSPRGGSSTPPPSAAHGEGRVLRPMDEV